VETLELTIGQLLFVVLVSPLFKGIYDNLKAKVEGRIGPPALQPYYELFKLFRKESLVPHGGGLLFRLSPYAAMAIYTLIALIIPVVVPVPIYFTASGDFLAGAILFSSAAFIKAIGASSSGSNYVALGVSRIFSFAFMSEATLITVFFSVSLLTGTNNPYVTNAFLVNNPGSILTLPHIFGTVSFAMLFLYEAGKLPTESHGRGELGMIESSVNYEYSGRLLAMNKWSSYIKQYLLGSVLLNVFLFPWFLSASNLYFDMAIMFAKWMLLILIMLIVDTSLSKLRLFKIVDYLGTAFTFSVLFLIYSEVIV